MPYGIPQSNMYAMRGRMADGNMVRNRSGEQQFSGSGNPAMPIFNTAPSPPPGYNVPGQGVQSNGVTSLGYNVQPVGGISNGAFNNLFNNFDGIGGGAPMPSFGPPAAPQMSPEWYAHQQQVVNAAQGPQTASVGSTMDRGIPINPGQGQIDPTSGRRMSAYSPYFRKAPLPSFAAPQPTNS